MREVENRMEIYPGYPNEYGARKTAPAFMCTYRTSYCSHYFLPYALLMFLKFNSLTNYCI